MKVLLRKNVYKLGSIGEVVKVKDGYARNYLIPQGIAFIPSDANLKQVEAEKAQYLAELAKQREELATRAKEISGKEVTISARSNEEGNLYGSVGPAQIAAAFGEIDVHINADEIIMSEPIRHLDKYDINVRFAEDITATVHVWVVPISGDLTSETTADVSEETEEPAEEITDEE